MVVGTRTRMEQILQVLSAGPKKPSELARELGVSRGYVNDMLAMLAGACRVKPVGGGRWQLVR